MRVMGCRQGGSLLPRDLGPFYGAINKVVTLADLGLDQLSPGGSYAG